MKPTNIRNSRDIPTIQGLKHRSVPAHREQIMSELARLEHEKARLEREITIWLSNQKKTQTRIEEVQKRVDLLWHMIEELSPKPQAAQSGQETEKHSENFREVNLEY